MRRLILLGVLFTAGIAALTGARGAGDTPKAAATRKLLKQKVTAEYKDEAFRVVIEELRQQVKNLSVFLDTKSGVPLNTKITLGLKDVPLEDVLKAICDKNGWGYYIDTRKNTAYDGLLVIKVGKERGYEDGKEPPAGAKDDAEAKDKPKAKGKPEPKEKKKPKEPAEPKAKPEPKDQAEPKEKPVDDEDRAERLAALKLKTAKELIAEGKTERAREVLEDLLKKYPRTKAADEAKDLQEKLKE